MISNRGGRVTATAVALAAVCVAANQVTASATTFGASWQMNETSGTVMHDSSGNGNNGALHNVKLNGSAYGFNGTSSYVSVPNSASLNPGTTNFRLTAAVKINKIPAANNDYDIVRKGLAGTAGGDYKLEVLATGKAFCHMKGSSGGVSIGAGPALSTGAFHTISCTKTATTVTLVVDGATVGKATVTVGSISNTSGVFVGAKPNDDYLNGYLNQVTISTV
jgi:Concanavalin A-like lectin/glucanases superfamily